jgi:hypothetical protein
VNRRWIKKIGALFENRAPANGRKNFLPTDRLDIGDDIAEDIADGGS